MQELIDGIANIKISDPRTSYVIKIQKLWRGYIARTNLQKLLDGMTQTILESMLDKYIDYSLFITNLNKRLNKKKCRNQNFPSEISENICKFAIYKKYKIMPSWDTTKGDLIMLSQQIEVKGFMSDGPSSFGPSEKWDKIYFVDCRSFANKKFKVFEIKLSHKHPNWRAIKLTQNSTFGEIADSNKRGQLRANFYKTFQPQLKNYCQLIFDGSFNDLFNN